MADEEQEDAVAQFLLLIKKLAEKLHEMRQQKQQAKMMKQQQKGDSSINKNSPMVSKKQEIFNQIEERKNEGKAPSKQIVAGEKIPSRAEGKNERMKEIDIKKLSPEERKKLKQSIQKELNKLQAKQKQVQKLRTQVNEIKAGIGKGGGGKSISLGHGGR